VPRTREFDPEEALGRAMELFWLKGYSDTSIDELVSETGASRYGLYTTFGDKHDLFMQSLKRYAREVFGPLIAQLEAPEASLHDIRAFFRGIRDHLRQPEGRRGCLMCNTAVELGPFDPASAERVRRHFRRVRAAFAHALKNARRTGELGREVDVAASADYLLGVAQGAFVLARSGLGLAAIERFLDTALKQLG
jgi:TetR/AcrR family transcriptional repressor of nem operon